LKARERDDGDDEIGRLKSRVREITMELLSNAKIAALEGERPLARAMKGIIGHEASPENRRAVCEWDGRAALRAARGCHLISLNVSGGIPRGGSWRRSCKQRGARHEGVERCQSLSAKTILLHQ
jgi:hypothetical protein